MTRGLYIPVVAMYKPRVIKISSYLNKPIYYRFKLSASCKMLSEVVIIRELA
jgi:hypothetical protein